MNKFFDAVTKKKSKPKINFSDQLLHIPKSTRLLTWPHFWFEEIFSIEPKMHESTCRNFSRKFGKKILFKSAVLFLFNINVRGHLFFSVPTFYLFRMIKKMKCEVFFKMMLFKFMLENSKILFFKIFESNRTNAWKFTINTSLISNF